jgi:3-hydroxybutyryl-CoA dehydrogenase
MIQIGVIGAGAMGSGIAQVAAQSGHSVLLYDTNLTVVEKAIQQIKISLNKLAEKGKISQQDSLIIGERIRAIDDIADLKDCGLIIEAIIEKLEIKQSVFKNLEQVVNADCILATNTSSLSIAAISGALENKSRFLGIHFFNPATLMPLVEIIPSFSTSEITISKSIDLIKSWSKTTVLAKDTPGFIVNRIARPFYGEALRIYEEGIADYATIDWAMKEIGGFKMGPFELMDFIGHDVNYRVTETVFEQMFYDPRYKPSITQKRLFEAGCYGRKTGRGYYDYSVDLPEAMKDNELGYKIFIRILVMLVNEAAEALHLNIASTNDIETAMTKGVNYPKGLLHWADEIGVDVIFEHLDSLYNWYAEDRYRPSILLKMKSMNNQTFF